MSDADSWGHIFFDLGLDHSVNNTTVEQLPLAASYPPPAAMLLYHVLASTMHSA